MEPEWFGPRLRELREAKGWTQRELAEKAGIGLSTVQNFEQNRRFPEWRTLLALAQALGVDLNAFGQKPTEVPVRPPPIVTPSTDPPHVQEKEGSKRPPITPTAGGRKKPGK